MHSPLIGSGGEGVIISIFHEGFSPLAISRPQENTQEILHNKTEICLLFTRLLCGEDNFYFLKILNTNFVIYNVLYNYLFSYFKLLLVSIYLKNCITYLIRLHLAVQ
jgi:hypothetical protein